MDYLRSQTILVAIHNCTAALQMIPEGKNLGARQKRISGEKMFSLQQQMMVERATLCVLHMHTWLMTFPYLLPIIPGIFFILTLLLFPKYSWNNILRPTCMCRLSQLTGGALKDSLLIAMTELLCCWEERRVAVEDSCEKGAAFQVQSLTAFVGEDAILLSIQMLCNLRELTD